jgi:hypothetical protein
VRQSAACCQHSLGVAKRSMRSPGPRTGPREDAAGSLEASRLSGSCHPHRCSVGLQEGAGSRERTVTPSAGAPRGHRPRLLPETALRLITPTRTHAARLRGF